MKKIVKFLPSTLLLVPVLVMAETFDGAYFASIITFVQQTIQKLILVLIGIAVLVFIWGLITYILSKEPEEQKKARGVMLYGIITLFVMISIWGIINLLQDVFKVDDNNIEFPELPNIQ